MGLQLRSPLIAASSGLTDNIGNIERFEKSGVGAVVLKSLFEEEIRIEKRANLEKMKSGGFLYPEILEFYDYNEGANDESTTKYLELVKKAKSIMSIPIIPSINCVTADQWIHFPRELENAGADAIELNVFIMPSDLVRTREETDKVYADILKEVTSSVKIPVALKVSSYFSDLAITLKKFSESGIKGLVMFNRFYSPDIDIDALEVTSGNVLSSPSDINNPIRWIGIMHDHVSCDLAASTGVYDGRAMIKLILAGASAVQAASVFYKNGIEYSDKMIDDLRVWMDSKGYNKIDDFKALLSNHETGNPAAFERVQFMKYFRNKI
jgi:dihydroorotate dehydrogenase (fumarate)